MRYAIIAAIGAVAAIAMIWLGFNFRLGGPGAFWLGGDTAYLPAMIAGAAIALAIDFMLRRWT